MWQWKEVQHCHWRIDQQVQRRNFQLERAWQALGQRIWQFGVGGHLVPEFVSAWELFWDNRIPVEVASALDMVQRIRFLNWYIYDYRTGNRKRVAERFLDEKGTDLLPLEQNLIRDWVKTHFSVYEITGTTEEHVDL